MAVTVRPLQADDHEAWVPLWLGYLDFYNVSESDRHPLDTWVRLMGDGGIAGLGAFLDGSELAGIAHFLLHPDTWAPQPACYLQDLFTRSDVRGRGIGRALISAVADSAAAFGCSRVYWLTATDNQPARRLYDAVADVIPFAVYELDLGAPVTTT